jgi:hypothetical protein
MNTELCKSEIENSNPKERTFVSMTLVTEEPQLRYLISQLPPTTAPLLGYLYNRLQFPDESEVYLFHSMQDIEVQDIRNIPLDLWIAAGGIWMRKRAGVEKPNCQLRFFDDSLKSQSAKSYSVFQKLFKMAKSRLSSGPASEAIPYWLPAQPDSHTQLLEEQGIKFTWTEPYDCYYRHNYQLDPVSIEKEFDIAVERLFEGSGPIPNDWKGKSLHIRCQVDHLNLDDIPTILSQKTVGYSPDYLEYLMNTKPFNLLNYCLRIVQVTQLSCDDPNLQDQLPKLGGVISWAITHQDYSTGLVGTIPAYRGLGLAKHVVKQTLNAQYFHLRNKSLPVVSFGFVSPTNPSSQRLFSSSGYVVGEKVNWVGLDV